jgi:serine/threonine protein phosphatase 1
MPQRQIVIGDVHGHYNALQELLLAIAPVEDEEVYFLGDLIDRGPDSAKVVEFVMNSGYGCVRGNHEEMLLNILARKQEDDSDENLEDLIYSWLYNGGQSTLASYNNNIPVEHIQWLQTLPLYLDLGKVWLVHAGVAPELSLAEQDVAQFCWIRDEFHASHEPYFPDKLIIVGHTITFTLPGVEPGKIAKGRGWLGIDTGVYHPSSYWLTAVDITNYVVYQYNHEAKILRKMPLEEATVEIEPSAIWEHRFGG